MPRKPRLHVPGGIYHVILRGNNRQPLFFSASDRLDFESLVEGGVARYACRVHAYCWMTNHVHLAVQAGRQPVGGFVQWVAGQYARRLNRRKSRCGHVFEKRHRALLVGGESYLLELIRYIHRNPVEARMVEKAGAYRWSSHAGYVGGDTRDWLTTHWVLSLFASRLSEARRLFDEFVHDDDAEARSCNGFDRGGNVDDRVVGDDRFLEQVMERAVQPAPLSLRSLDDVVASVCEAHGIREVELIDRTRTRRYAKIRAEIAKKAIEMGVATLSQVARRFGRSDAVICRSVKRYFGSGDRNE